MVPHVTYEGSVQWFANEDSWVVRVTSNYGGSVPLQNAVGISPEALAGLLPQIGANASVYRAGNELMIVGLDQYAGRALEDLLRRSFTVVCGRMVLWNLKNPCYH